MLLSVFFLQCGTGYGKLQVPLIFIIIMGGCINMVFPLAKDTQYLVVQLMTLTEMHCITHLLLIPNHSSL